MVEEKTFRADLFYRLNGMTITVPPLRERAGDIPLLLRYFLGQAQRTFNKHHIEGLSPECLEILSNYGWPGNVREMQSVVQQAVLNAIGPIIIPEFLPREVTANRPARGHVPASIAAPGGLTLNDADCPPIASLGPYIEERLLAKSTDLSLEAIDRLERYLFTRVLQATNGNQSQASEILGVTRGKIRDRIAAFNISMERKVRIDAEELANV